MLKQLFARAGFDPGAYTSSYVDLASFSSDAALNHAVKYGIFEGRQFVFDNDPRRLAEAIADVSVPRRQYELFLWVLCQSLSHEAIFELSRRLRLTPFVIVGDSHSNHYLSKSSLRHSLVPIQFSCTGGSARGLLNSQSRSGHGHKIQNFLKEYRHPVENALVLFKFGGVDVEFVFNFKRVQQGSVRFDRCLYERFIAESVERYIDFLQSLPSIKALAIASIFPPALADESLIQGYVNAHIAFLESDQSAEMLTEQLRTLEHPTLRERTGMHRDFNERLKYASEKAGFAFLDDFSPFINFWTGLLNKRFITRSCGKDHHLDPLPATDAVVGRVIGRLAKMAPRQF